MKHVVVGLMVLAVLGSLTFVGCTTETRPAPSAYETNEKSGDGEPYIKSRRGYDNRGARREGSGY